MIGLLIRGVVNLARTVEYAVQAGRSFVVSFKWIFPLTGSKAPESGVYRCIVWAIFIISTFVFIASWFSIAIPDFGCARITGATTGQPVVLARTKSGHELVKAAIVLGFSWPRCLASHSSRTLCLKAAKLRRPDSRLFGSF